jgi:hypothetical protein
MKRLVIFIHQIVYYEYQDDHIKDAIGDACSTGRKYTHIKRFSRKTSRENIIWGTQV